MQPLLHVTPPLLSLDCQTENWECFCRRNISHLSLSFILTLCYCLSSSESVASVKRLPHLCSSSEVSAPGRWGFNCCHLFSPLSNEGGNESKQFHPDTRSQRKHGTASCKRRNKLMKKIDENITTNNSALLFVYRNLSWNTVGSRNKLQMRRQ